MPRSFGGTRQTGAGWWQAYYPGPDGRRVLETTHFPTKAAARAWLDDLARDREQGSWRDPVAWHQRFDQFATTWLASARIAPSTKDLYAGYLDNRISACAGLPRRRPGLGRNRQGFSRRPWRRSV